MSFTVTRTYSNGVERQFVVVSYVYDEATESAILTTEQDGDVAITAVDTPDVWAQFLEEM